MVVLILILIVLFIFLNLHSKIENFENQNKITASYFINLDRQDDRRKYMEEQFRENNINCKKFSAFDKKLLNKNKIEEMKKNNILDINHNPKPHKLGSIACLVSHVNLYKKIYEEYNGGIFLIFEDDCKILPDFNKKLDYYLARLPEDWDMIWLGYNKIKGKRYDENFYIPDSGLIWHHNSQHHCYLLNYKFIPQLIKILMPIKQNFNTNDTVLRVNFHKFKPFFLRERLAVQDMEEFPTSERTGGKNG